MWYPNTPAVAHQTVDQYRLQTAGALRVDVEWVTSTGLSTEGKSEPRDTAVASGSAASLSLILIAFARSPMR
jgi:hypothetical protein